MHQHLQNITDSKLIPLRLDLYTLSASSPLFLLSPPTAYPSAPIETPKDHHHHSSNRQLSNDICKQA